eukprot:12299139-Alexandrium_andersonii.AAC.1
MRTTAWALARSTVRFPFRRTSARRLGGRFQRPQEQRTFRDASSLSLRLSLRMTWLDGAPRVMPL